MTRLELLKAVLAQPDPQDLPTRSYRQVYATASSKVQLYTSPKTPLRLAVAQWKRRFAA